MKKLKVIIPIIVLLLLIILFGLSFLRLPINLLSQEIIERETKGLVSLNSLSNQTLKILPKPILSIDNSSFKINHNIFQSDIVAKDVEISILNIISIFLSFMLSLVTINYFLKYIKRFSLNIFVLYRIILGITLLSLAYL